MAAEAAREPLALDEQYAVVSVRHSRAQLPLRSPPEPALPRSPLEPTPAPCVPHGPCRSSCWRRRLGDARAVRGPLALGRRAARGTRPDRAPLSVLSVC